MVEIGGRPLLWHIMKGYSVHGINDFVICLGYRGYLIKEYFANYGLHMSDVTIDMRENAITVHERNVEPWRVTLVDTGEDTNTGGRLRRVRPYVETDEIFCFTYGDGLSDVDIAEEVAFHQRTGSLATVLAVRPPGRYGALRLEGPRVSAFEEKPPGDGGYISGGFFVVSSACLDRIDGDSTSWEGGPLVQLAAEGQLSAFIHHGFWRPMDTLREKTELESLWASGQAPWKTW